MESAVGQLQLSPEQAQRVEKLRELAGVSLAGEGTVQASPQAQGRALPNVGRGRLLISLLLILATILPFVGQNLGIGDLPPEQFKPDSPAVTVFERIDNVDNGTLVIVAVEYSPTGASELDDSTNVILRHLLAQGARPVLVSSNAVGLLHARNLLETIVADAEANGIALVENEDYFVIRYLAGGVIGLREFAQSAERIVTTDVEGKPTNLALDSIFDFEMVIVIAERADDLRAWVEQIRPNISSPLIAVTGFSAQPLVQPYLDVDGTSGVQGLVGAIGMLIPMGRCSMIRWGLFHPRRHRLQPIHPRPPMSRLQHWKRRMRLLLM